MDVYVTLKGLTNKERLSMHKLIGIDLAWFLKKWVRLRKNRDMDLDFTEFIEKEVATDVGIPRDIKERH